MTGPSAGTSHVTELRGVRYGEIFLITSQAGQLTAAVYNTAGLNDCPPAAWRSLDPHELAKDFGVPAVHLNGPRFWTLDQIAARATRHGTREPVCRDALGRRERGKVASHD